MPHPLVAAFLDTTEFASDSSLQSASWDSLRKAVIKGQLVVAVSEVTVRELVRQTAERVEKYNEQTADGLRRLRQHLPDLPAATHAVSSAEFENKFRQRLRWAGVAVLPLPTADHGTVLERDIEARRPFKRSGTGYRDALIWLSFADWVAGMHAVPAMRVHFVSANTSDFSDSDGQIHPDLTVDLPPTVSVRYARQLADIVKAIRPAGGLGLRVESASASNVRAAGIAECRALSGFPLDDLAVLEPFPELPPIQEGVIGQVEVDEKSAKTVLVDVVDGTQIWDVTASARISVAGFVYRDVESIPDGWKFWRSARRDDLFEVRGSLMGNFTVDVRVNDREVVIDSAVSGVVLRRANHWMRARGE